MINFYAVGDKWFAFNDEYDVLTNLEDSKKKVDLVIKMDMFDEYNKKDLLKEVDKLHLIPLNFNK